MAIKLVRRRFTIHEYHRMADIGILDEDDGVELIRGEIIGGEENSPRHANCINTCARICIQSLNDSAIVSVQNPVQLSLYDEPLPDLAILRPRMDYYGGNHPTVDDILLLLEVADHSITYDRAVKLPIYAATSVQEVWLVDLNRQRILRFSGPGERGYKVVRQFRRQITSIAIPELSIETGTILRL